MSRPSIQAGQNALKTGTDPLCHTYINATELTIIVYKLKQSF